jgi:hypothetical protein
MVADCDASSRRSGPECERDIWARVALESALLAALY